MRLRCMYVSMYISVRSNQSNYKTNFKIFVVDTITEIRSKTVGGRELNQSKTQVESRPPLSCLFQLK